MSQEENIYSYGPDAGFTTTDGASKRPAIQLNIYHVRPPTDLCVIAVDRTGKSNKIRRIYRRDAIYKKKLIFNYRSHIIIIIIIMKMNWMDRIEPINKYLKEYQMKIYDGKV